MDEKQVEEILQRYLTGLATEQEKSAVETWYNELPYKTGSPDQSQVLSDKASNWNSIAAKTETVRPISTPLWKKWSVAAAVAFAVMTGGYFYSQNSNQPVTESVYANDIAPGKEGATLTLSNGQKILIKDALAGNIATQSGVKISKTADGEIIYEVIPDNSKILTYNTLTTTRGEQTRVRLPDGTLVFLNAESSLKYPTSFASSAKREVSLSGEGYFDVAKDKQHPFVVATDNQKVEVLGTHFNIRAYGDQALTRTTLLEGSVRVENNVSKKSQLLVPGQQSSVSGNSLNVSSVDVDEAVAWKEGVFMYDGETFENIMRDVARWYNVEVEFAEPSLKKKSIYITANKFDHISELLKPLGRTAKASFEIKGKKIIVNKKDN